jgi:hypothetical protein
MSATAERVLEEIRSLSPAEVRQIWEQLSRLVSEINFPSIAVEAPVSGEEFAAALDEVTGCTTGSRSLERLLQDRRNDLDSEQRWLTTTAPKKLAAS